MRLYALGSLAAWDADGFHDGEDVLLDREFPKDGCFLGQVTNPVARPLVHPESGDVRSIQEYAAGGCGHQADNHVEGRGLPRTIGPEQADDFPGPETDADAINDRLGAVGL